MAKDEKDPVDQALDLLLYAPIGLAYEAKDLLPKLAKRGKAQADLMRVAGEFAVRNSQGDIESFIRAAAAAAGFGPTADADADDGDTEAASLPLDDYDEMIASDIVKLLDDLDAEQLRAVQAHELRGRGRVTILNKIDRLLGDDG